MISNIAFVKFDHYTFTTLTTGIELVRVQYTIISLNGMTVV